MPFEKNGRADKYGNRYESKWVINQLLKLVDEKIAGVIVEAIGDDESGVDIWIKHNDGRLEAQQCKARNSSKDYWDFGSLNANNIIEKSMYQISRNPNNLFSLISPLACTMLNDISSRAKNTNGTPEDFYTYQIKGSGQELIRFFQSVCKELNIDPNNNSDLVKIIDYFRRFEYKQYPESSEQKAALLDKIKFLFLGNNNDLYNLLLYYIVEEDILGTEITNVKLINYIITNGFELRNCTDERTLPRIYQLNQEYKSSFIPVSNRLMQRTEFKECIKAISNGHSLIIHGHAGSGKSGATQAIIEHCESWNIPYIAIKLDKRIPDSSSEKFGKDLGLPSSLVVCLNDISKNSNGVLILDQLDALRWTKAHSRSSLDVCSEIIREVNSINTERDIYMSIVLVCRTYDLENDNNIKSLLDRKNERTFWERVILNGLDEQTVKDIVGDQYNNLSAKLRSVLKVFSSLYIWSRLEKNKNYNEFTTANDLFTEWWKQLCLNCRKDGINSSDLVAFKEQLVDIFDKQDKLFINRKLVAFYPECVEYLISNGLIVFVGANLSFTHQSMFDYFLVEKHLLKLVQKRENILEIIGGKDKQTPIRRYQLQMLLQNISDIDIDLFIDFGKQLLSSDNVRFYFKHVFLELFGQTNTVTGSVKDFLLEHLYDANYRSHIYENVIYGHFAFIKLLYDLKILDNWLSDDENKHLAVSLLSSISNTNSIFVVEVISKYLFKNEKDDEILSSCFSYNIVNDSDEMFNLRLEFYKTYPKHFNAIANLKELFKKCEDKAIELIEFMLKHKLKKDGNSIYRYEEEILNEHSDIIVNNSTLVIKKLLPLIPRFKEDDKYDYKDWLDTYAFHQGIERASISLLKKALKRFIVENSIAFWNLFSDYLGKGFVLYNELILFWTRICSN